MTPAYSSHRSPIARSTVSSDVSAVGSPTGGSNLEAILAGAPETSRLTPVLNPTIYYVNSLRDTLIRKGIEVTGAAVDVVEASPVG